MPIVTRVNFPPKLTDFEGWEETKRILVILAHPDDPEFFCGATLFRWAKLGHEIHYCLLTSGQKGSPESEINPEGISKIRKLEQQEAADFMPAPPDRGQSARFGGKKTGAHGGSPQGL